MSATSSFKDIENKHDVHWGKDYMKKQNPEQHAMKIVDFKKKKMELLTNEQQESYENAKTCYL